MIDRKNDMVTAMAAAYGHRGRSAVLAATPAPRPAAPTPKPTGHTAAAPAAATPHVQRMAAERGVALADVRGTGTGGRITATDVRAANLAAAGQRRGDTRSAAPRAGGLERGAEEYKRRTRRSDPFEPGTESDPGDNAGRTAEHARPARTAASLTAGAKAYEQRRGHAVPDKPGA